MALIDHPTGDYRFLPGIAPYSCGVVSKPGFEIVHVVLQEPVAVAKGFSLITDYLAAKGRPRSALCAIALRSPRPYTFAGFAEFNAGYASVLQSWGVFVDGVNPIARTNVAPVFAAPSEPVLYAFSYSRPCSEAGPATFIVAGAGELPEGALSRDGIVALGDVSPQGLEVKARFVMDLMESRLRGLGVDWSTVGVVDVYTAHSLTPLLSTVLLERLGATAVHGVHWHFSRPPIEDIEYEMDVRGVRTEIRLR
jgi:hypothetical protein